MQRRCRGKRRKPNIRHRVVHLRPAQYIGKALRNTALTIQKRLPYLHPPTDQSSTLGQIAIWAPISFRTAGRGRINPSADSAQLSIVIATRIDGAVWFGPPRPRRRKKDIWLSLSLVLAICGELRIFILGGTARLSHFATRFLFKHYRTMNDQEGTMSRLNVWVYSSVYRHL